MDLGLANRTALVVAAGDEIGAACARVLETEGATVVAEPSPDVDIVVAQGAPLRPTALLDCRSADELHDAWAPVIETIAAYRRALPGMASRSWGRLVWIGSAAAKSLDGDDDELGGVVSLAMMGVHKVIAAEGGPDGITANAVLRGGEATADDVAAVVAFLCSEGAGYLTGVTVTVDGGAGSAMF